MLTATLNETYIYICILLCLLLCYFTETSDCGLFFGCDDGQCVSFRTRCIYKRHKFWGCLDKSHLQKCGKLQTSPSNAISWWRYMYLKHESSF